MSEDGSESVEESIGDLVERVEAALEGIREALDEPDADLSDVPELLGEDPSDETVEYVHDLWEVAAEAQDVVETIDVSELPEAIEFDELDELIDAEEIPEAIAEGDPDEAIDLGKLLQVLDLSELWDVADVAELWDDKRELSDAIDDVTEGDAEDSLADDLLDGDGMLDDVDLERPEFDGIDDFDPETIENAVQYQAMQAIEGLRDALIETHQTVDRLRQENLDKLPEQDRETHSRNPTAVSLLPPRDRDDVDRAGRYSTVPRKVRNSSAPGLRRVYGSRFDQETTND